MATVTSRTPKCLYTYCSCCGGGQEPEPTAPQRKSVLSPRTHQVLRRRIGRRLEAQQPRRRRRPLLRVLQGICCPAAGLAQQAQRAGDRRGPCSSAGGAGFCGQQLQGSKRCRQGASWVVRPWQSKVRGACVGAQVPQRLGRVMRHMQWEAESHTIVTCTLPPVSCQADQTTRPKSRLAVPRPGN